MHFCFVNMPIEFYSPTSGGAIATVIMHTARELISRGHHVSVLTVVNNDETYDIGDVIAIEGNTKGELNVVARFLSRVKGKIARYDWPFFEYYLRSFIQQLSQFSPPPDVVVLFNDLVSSKYVKKLLPTTKVVVWLHNEWRTRHDVAATVRTTDVFLTCSDYVRRWTTKMHPIPLRSFAVAHNGVDSDAFYPREDYLRKPDRVRVLFLGRLDPNKGPDLTADAVRVLREEGFPLDLTVAGGLWFYGHGNELADPYFRILKQKMEAARANYTGHIIRQNVPELIRGHDIVCVLSRANEPFGLVALEAMASGCAVIASNRGGLPEACGDAANLVDPDDFNAVVGALRNLVADAGTLMERKRQSLIQATQMPWSNCAKVLEDTTQSSARAACTN